MWCWMQSQQSMIVQRCYCTTLANVRFEKDLPPTWAPKAFGWRCHCPPNPVGEVDDYSALKASSHDFVLFCVLFWAILWMTQKMSSCMEFQLLVAILSLSSFGWFLFWLLFWFFAFWFFSGLCCLWDCPLDFVLVHYQLF